MVSGDFGDSKIRDLMVQKVVTHKEVIEGLERRGISGVFFVALGVLKVVT